MRRIWLVLRGRGRFRVFKWYSKYSSSGVMLSGFPCWDTQCSYCLILQQCQQSAHTLTLDFNPHYRFPTPSALSLFLLAHQLPLAPAIRHILSPRAHPCFNLSTKLRNSHTSLHAQTLPDSSVAALWFRTAYASLPQAALRKWGTITRVMHYSLAN